VFLKRLFPLRWASIVAWTGAALAWGSVGVAATANGQANDGETPPSPEPVAPVTTAAVTRPTIPESPDSGLVIIRYTPVEPPAAQVIVNTVTKSAPGKTAANAPAKAAAPAQVKSSGS